jgi:hypothetical protein
MKLEKKDRIEILENAFAYIVVFAMFAYGIGKMVQFNGAVPVNKTVSELTGQQLMWAFYGYSKPFVIVLGIMEIMGGFLMLIRRTRILGCFLITTILVNVILQDIFYGVNVGALRAAVIYQTLIFVILWLNKEKLIQCFKILLSETSFDGFKKKFFVKIILSVLLFVILRILEFYVTTKW